jgi:hypothetical protein
MLRPRNVPADILEDIKIGKILSIPGLICVIIATVISVALSFIIIPFPLFRVFFVLAVAFFTTIIMAADLPGYFKRLIRFRRDKKSIKDLDQLNNIEEYGPIVKNKDGSEAVYIDYSVDPWEVSPDDIKESRAMDFAQRVFAAVSIGTEVSVFSTCSSEKSTLLEKRLERLSEFPQGIREIESARIEHHYNLSRHASKTEYTIRILKRPDGDAEEDIEEIQDAMVFDGACLGSGSIKSRIKTQLTPDSNVKRGGINFDKH